MLDRTIRIKDKLEDWGDVVLLAGFSVFGVAFNADVFASAQPEPIHLMPFLDIITQFLYSIGALFAVMIGGFKAFWLFLDIKDRLKDE
jgi:hypothetical protein